MLMMTLHCPGERWGMEDVNSLLERRCSEEELSASIYNAPMGGIVRIATDACAEIGT
jgi:hypothetical protein